MNPTRRWLLEIAGFWTPDYVARPSIGYARDNFGRGFFRFDCQATQRDIFRLQAMGGRSHFQIANLRSQEAAGQDQRQTLKDGAVWGSYLRSLNSGSTFEAVAGYRANTAKLDPSAP